MYSLLLNILHVNIPLFLLYLARSRPFSGRHNQQDGVLKIRGVKSSDHGPYFCQLLANDGTVLFELKANLIVKGRIEGGAPQHSRLPGRQGSRDR